MIKTTRTYVRIEVILRRPVKPINATWAFFVLPEVASAKLPTRSQVTVEGALGSAPFQATLESDGEGSHWLEVDKPLLEAAGAEPGDTITLDITYYVGIVYVPTLLTSTGARGKAASLGLSTWAAVAVILLTPLAGLLPDRLGRRPVLVLLTLCSAVLPITLFAMMTRGSEVSALAGALVLACVAGGVSAVRAVATAEQFPGEGRLSGLARGATLATAVFGGLTPLLAQWLVGATGWPLVPGALIAVVAILVLPVLAWMPETAPLAGRGRMRAPA